MKTNSRFFTILTGIFFVSISAHINAATFAFGYSGTVSTSNHSGISVGTSFTGQISYADDLLGSSSGPTVYFPINISLTIGGETVNFFTAALGINDGPPGGGAGFENWDYFNFADFGTNPTIVGEELDFFDFSSVDNTGMAIDSENLITSFDVLNSTFPRKILRLQFLNTVNGAPMEVIGNNVQLEPVPIPAAVWLFGSGLIGLIGVARRKKS